MRMLVYGVLALATMTGAAGAQSASCGFTVSDINFGTVDALQATTVTEFGTLTIDCTSDVRRVCPNIGAGSGGATTTTRFMKNLSTGTTLDFQLYDSGGQVWGSTYVSPPGGNPPTVDLDASGDASLQIYGELTPALTQAGSYSSVFTDTDFAFGGLDLDCSAPAAGAVGTGSPSFTVSANLVPSCSFQAQNVDFGSHGVLSAGISAMGGVNVTCTAQTPYTVSLGPGNAGPGTPPNDRRMSAPGGGQIRYGLYKDAAFTQGWGDSPETTESDIGTGGEQHLPVYGEVPSQSTPASGIYMDTIVVTVTIAE